ncbi:MAG TPA: VWA domain-containing protein [Vicinamibacterales bacterium]|nr:VWA domain-containing protein [Vicinamibacterales bacterium]
MLRVGIVATVVLVAVVRAFAQQTVFRAETDLVSFGVTVLDRRGSFVTDLTGEHFEIVEDGKPQALKYFIRGDQADAAPELHLGLLFDTSGSMSADIATARTAAIKFLNALPEAKDITVVDFDTEVRLAKYGQQDFPRIVERIRNRKPDGFTAMYDALGQYVNGANADPGRKVMVLFTDGGDTRSALGFTDVMTLLRGSDVTVYPVGFMQNQSSSNRNLQRVRLAQIAEESGGEAFFPLSMKEIEAAFERILIQVRAQYTVGYVSTNTAQDGRWRKVEIKVRRPDLTNLRIQTRKGYFGPYKASR